MSVAHQANIEWYAPQQVWEPIHARVDESSEWFGVHLERAEEIADSWKGRTQDRKHTIYGFIAEAVVLNVFPHIERFPTRSITWCRRSTCSDKVEQGDIITFSATDRIQHHRHRPNDVVPRGGGIPSNGDESQHKARGDDDGRDTGHGRPPTREGRVGVLRFDILFLKVVLDRGGDGKPCKVVGELVADDHERRTRDRPHREWDAGEFNHGMLC